MRKAVLDYVQSCVACLSAIPRNTPVPLEPNLLPERAWQNLHADFKGPIGGQYYFHILIDQFSKYPEVDVLTSTSFKKLRPKLDRIFSAQGIPEKVTADNGPPYPCHEMREYASEMGFKMDLLTPEDPQSNGFAEVFVKILCKLIHTSVAEGKDPREELHKYLLHYRATPHPTTGKSPAEMLNNRKIRTKLPQYFKMNEGPEASQIRKEHDAKKMIQKKNFDKGRRVQQKVVKTGDKILVKQQKSTTKPPFDPKPYTVVHVDGNQIEAERDGKFRRRDKNSVKILKKRPQYLIPSWDRTRHAIKPTHYEEQDIEGSWPEPEQKSQINDIGEVNQEEPETDLINEPPNNAEKGRIINDFQPAESENEEQTNDGRISTMTPDSPPFRLPRALKKGDRVAFKGKEENAEWFTCTLLSRAGRAKGRYTLAWNISRDGILENIDFERDVGEFTLLTFAEESGRKVTENSDQEAVDLEATEDNTATKAPAQMNMNAYLAALIEAAVQREENHVVDESV